MLANPLDVVTSIVSARFVPLFNYLYAFLVANAALLPLLKVSVPNTNRIR